MKDEQAQLRKMIADCLRYIKNLNTGRFGYGWVPREDVEVHKDTIDTTYSGVSLASLVDYIDPKDYGNVFVRGRGSEGSEEYDGYSAWEVEIYSLRKQTDKEYFESLCGYILPAEYQQNQYETYLRLKKQFGE
jgi:hypothetical protein